MRAIAGRVRGYRATPHARGGPHGFLPVQLPGLKVWLSGDYGAGVAGTWTNLGSSGNAAQATGNKQPTLNATGINGKPALSFSGSQALSIASVTLTSFTIAVTMKLSGTAGSIIEHNDVPGGLGTNGFGFSGTTGNTTQTNRAGVASSWDLTSNWAVDNAVRVVVVQYDGTHAGHTLSINGVVQTLTNQGAGNPGSASLTAPLYICSRGPAGSETLFSTGLVRHVVVCSPVLSAGNVAALTAFLRKDAGV